MTYVGSHTRHSSQPTIEDGQDWQSVQPLGIQSVPCLARLAQAPRELQEPTKRPTTSRGGWAHFQEKGKIRNIPLTEGGSVDDNDGVLDEGLGPDKLVVASIVDDVDDPGLASGRLRGPCKVASVQPECPVLLVATPGPEGVDPLGSELGHRRGASQLELPLLPEQIDYKKFKISGMLSTKFHLMGHFLPPVALRLCQWSREIPISTTYLESSEVQRN